MDPITQPDHMGDGAYVSSDGTWGFVITANHHDPRMASDKVHFDNSSIPALKRWLTQHEENLKSFSNQASD